MSVKISYFRIILIQQISELNVLLMSFMDLFYFTNFVASSENSKSDRLDNFIGCNIGYLIYYKVECTIIYSYFKTTFWSYLSMILTKLVKMFFSFFNSFLAKFRNNVPTFCYNFGNLSSSSTILLLVPDLYLLIEALWILY